MLTLKQNSYKAVLPSKRDSIYEIWKEQIQCLHSEQGS